MPFIRFDDEGVCNYCRNYKQRNKPKPKEELFKLLSPIAASMVLTALCHFQVGETALRSTIINELKMKPITYTYDWGMVTDLGRRNISRMCAELGVENIIVADDITKKRDNIAMNLRAWLNPLHRNGQYPDRR